MISKDKIQRDLGHTLVEDKLRLKLKPPKVSRTIKIKENEILLLYLVLVSKLEK